MRKLINNPSTFELRGAVLFCDQMLFFVDKHTFDDIELAKYQRNIKDVGVVILMTIYDSTGGAIAYTVDGNTIFLGTSNTVAFRISGNTIYEGLGGKIAYTIDGNTVYAGTSNTIAFQISGDTVYEGSSGNIAFKTGPLPQLTVQMPQQTYSPMPQSPTPSLQPLNTQLLPSQWGEMTITKVKAKTSGENYSLQA